MSNLAGEQFTSETRVVDGFLSGLLTRRQAIGRLTALGVGVIGASALLTACRTNPGPNILLIIADDMRLDWLPFMPNVQQLIQAEGCTFTEARCNVGLCQPSRVGLMTGQMSKHNNELSVGYNGTQLTDLNNTLGAWLSGVGYRCGLFGKFINFWDGFGGVNAPLGWKNWLEIINANNSYDFQVHLNTGTKRIIGTYDTDYLAAQVAPFTSATLIPFFCVLTPTQPHGPYTPRTDLKYLYSDLAWHIVDEVDVSDKPSWVQAQNPLTIPDHIYLTRDVKFALRELAAVDDMVGKVIRAIPAERLAETIIVFTSDNGVHFGEHRRVSGSKSGPYDTALHVPLIVRGPGFAPGSQVSAPVMVFQDIAATALKAAGASPGLPNQTGVPLVDIAANPGAYADRVLLHEIGQGFLAAADGPVRGDGLTTGPDHSMGFRKLFRYPSVRSGSTGPFIYEAYDLDTDPDELANWANDEARRPERDALETQLNAALA